MSITIRKERRANGKVYFKLYEIKRVKGKVTTKYVGYLGKSPKSKTEIEAEELIKYVGRLLNKEISQEDIKDILKKMGIEYDVWPITKIIIENDLKLKKAFLRLK